MAFSPQFLDELRSRIGLADVVGKRVKLTRKGHEHLGLCPFHKEKTPSFTLNEEKGFYHCFGCGAHGSAIDFAMQTDGLSFPEAVERLAAEAGMEIPADSPEERQRSKERQSLYDVVEAAAAFFEKSLRMPEGKKGLDYFHARGLDDETISRFRLGFAPDARDRIKTELTRQGISEDLMVAAGLLKRPDDGRSPFGYFRNRVIFPICDKRGRAIAFGGRILGPGEPKYLNSPETALFKKGRILYGLNLAAAVARKEGTLVVAEGYMDVIALARAGIGNAVAPLGTALTEEQIGELWRVVRDPVLCFDGDKAGNRAAARAAERALPLLKSGYALRFAALPPGEDPDSLIEKEGVAAMARVLSEAVPLSDLLWRMEAGTGGASSPEDRAALQKRLEDHARRIADPTVRGHFLKYFKDRIWDGGQGRQRNRSGPAPSAIKLTFATAPRAKVHKHLIAQQVLVTIIVNHPDFFQKVEDQFGSLSFEDGALDGLRQELVHILSGAETLDRDEIRTELRRRGMDGALGLLEDVRFMKAIGPEASFEAVEEAWEDNFERLRDAAFGSEITRQVSEIKTELSNAKTEDAMTEEQLIRVTELRRALVSEQDD